MTQTFKKLPVIFGWTLLKWEEEAQLLRNNLINRKPASDGEYKLTLEEAIKITGISNIETLRAIVSSMGDFIPGQDSTETTTFWTFYPKKI